MNAAVQQDINSAFVALSKAYAGNLSDPYPTYAKLRAKCPVYEGDLVAELGIPSMVAAIALPLKSSSFCESNNSDGFDTSRNPSVRIS